MSGSGGKPAPRAAAARMGIMRVVVAVLLVISVRKVITRQMTAMVITGGKDARAESWVPRASLMPVALEASGDGDTSCEEEQHSPRNLLRHLPVQSCRRRPGNEEEGDDSDEGHSGVAGPGHSQKTAPAPEGFAARDPGQGGEGKNRQHAGFRGRQGPGPRTLTGPRVPSFRVSHSQSTGIITSTTGTPQPIQSRKLRAVPVVFS